MLTRVPFLVLLIWHRTSSKLLDPAPVFPSITIPAWIDESVRKTSSMSYTFSSLLRFAICFAGLQPRVSHVLDVENNAYNFELGCGLKPMAPFGVGAPPIGLYFSGDWDVRWGYGIGPMAILRSGLCLRKLRCIQPYPDRAIDPNPLKLILQGSLHYTPLWGITLF